MSESFNPRERIRKKKDFLFLYRKGNRYKGKYFSLIYLPSSSTFSRVGVVASRKVGNAATRNKVKRWMRELFRRNKGLLDFPLDMLIIARPEMGEVKWEELKEQYLTAVERIFKKKKER
ncbi:MAG: ribonuclease P protein component [Clostridiales bacterium]|nr:ribonuclease P protein component [Clostridiales bacterium]